MKFLILLDFKQVICHLSIPPFPPSPSPPQIKGNLDLGRFDLTNFDPPPPKIKGNLDLGRFDMTNFDTPLPQN